MAKVKAKKKSALTYAISEQHEDVIRSYVENFNEKIGTPKQRIVTELILDGIEYREQQKQGEK